MAKNNANLVKLDVAKIRKHFEERGIPFTELGPNLGRGKNFLSSCLHSGYMNIHSYRLWIKTWDVPYETFILPEVEESTEVISEDTEDVITLLKEVIRLQKEMIDMWKND